MKKQLVITSNIKTFAAILVSAITNPVLIIFCSFLIGNLNLISIYPLDFVLYIFITILPAMVIYIVYFFIAKSENIFKKSIDREKRDDIFLIIFSFLMFSIFVTYKLPTVNLWFGYSVIFSILIGFFYFFTKTVDKISVHTGFFTFSILFLIDKISNFFVPFLLFLPIIFWARLFLHKHTYFQLVFGTVIGGLVGILSWLI